MSRPVRLATLPCAAVLAALGQPPASRPPWPGAARPPAAADTGRYTLRQVEPADPRRWTLRQFGACDPAAAARDPAGRVPLCERGSAAP